MIAVAKMAPVQHGSCVTNRGPVVNVDVRASTLSYVIRSVMFQQS